MDTYGMTDLGYLIMLDRYAKKDTSRKEIHTDSIVLVRPDIDSPQKEVGTVVGISSFSDTECVDIILEGGKILNDEPIDQLDIPLEVAPFQIWNRVAEAVASVEKQELREGVGGIEDQFREILIDWTFIPAGRILASAGVEESLSSYNCYVLPSPKDSKEGITNTLLEMINIMSRGGGVGINVSSLRPRGAPTYTTNGRSSGAVNWAELYSHATGLIEQGGNRRGALMIVMNDWHPDILEFVNAKRDQTKLTNCNISVAISDEFMGAVERDADWNLHFPDTRDDMYDSLWHGDLANWRRDMDIGKRKVIIHKTIKARELWDAIAESAHASGEPGIVFLDTANRFSNSHYYNQLICTNPCAEQPLPAHGVCNLGSINLSKFVKKDKTFEFNRLAKVVKVAVRFLDNVIDLNKYVDPLIEENQKSERRIGLGTLGLAEVLMRMEVVYGSQESLELIDNIYQVIMLSAYEASTELAKEKGAFPNFVHKEFIKSEFIIQNFVGYCKVSMDHMHDQINDIRNILVAHGIRNVTILSQAPTGTIGTMVNTSTGIEPYFALEYQRTSRLGTHMERVGPYDEYLRKISYATHGGPENLPFPIPEHFVTAQNVHFSTHVRVQAQIQKYVDSAISKTVNFPEDASIKDVQEVYEIAYKLKCKGLAIYRDKSRDEQILNEVENQELWPDDKDSDFRVEGQSEKSGFPNYDEMPLASEEAKYNPFISREEVHAGNTHRKVTPVGTAFITVNNAANLPIEVFITIGKAGSDICADAEALGRMISSYLMLPSSTSQLDKLLIIVDQLNDIGGSSSTGFGPNRVKSLPDAVAQVLVTYVPKEDFTMVLEEFQLDRELIVSEEEYKLDTMHADLLAEKQSTGDMCPQCSNFSLIHQDSCIRCVSCDYTKC